MGSLLSECLRHCLPPQQGGSNNISYQPPRPVSSTQRMTRSAGARIVPSPSYAETTATDDDEYSDEENGGGGGCQVTDESVSHADASPLTIFWQRLSSKLGGRNEYASLEARTSNDSSNRFNNKSEDSKCDQSPTLRAASNFEDTKGGIPSIALDEVVLPGSELQRIMAKKMSLSIEDQGDECVICMEGFDETNPRMPTLCGCGENKTYFHLPCLYQWIEQSRECPSCRKPLRWEEF